MKSLEIFLVGTFLAASLAAVDVAPPVQIEVGQGPFNIAVADIDGDGTEDLVLNVHHASEVLVMRNASTPTALALAPTRLAVAQHPQGLALADLDGDGRVDIVTASSGASSSVAMFRNLSSPGTVSFANRIAFPLPVAHRVATGDIDGDGRVDVVATSNANFARVYRNSSAPGALSFSPVADLQGGFFLNSVAVGDLDADGKPDVALSNINNDLLVLYRNTSSPGVVSFEPRLDQPVGDGPDTMQIADVDGDGIPEVLIENLLGHSISMLGVLDDGFGLDLDTRVDSPLGFRPDVITLADVDRDGRRDVLVTSAEAGKLAVLLNASAPGDPALAASQILWSGEPLTFPHFSALAVLRTPSIIVSNHTSDTISVFELDGNADLELDHTVSPATAASGDHALFTVTVTNHGPGNATAVRIEEYLPPELTLQSCETTVGTCGGSPSLPTVATPILVAGGAVVASFEVAVGCDTVDGTQLTAVAGVTATEEDPSPDDNSASAALIVSNPAPILSALSPVPPVLWPPDHGFQEVVVTYAATDNCPLPATACNLAVASSEPVMGRGDGTSDPDWFVVDPHRVLLRRERSGAGGGRTYTLTATCVDSGGAATAASTTVTVPHDRR